VSIEACIRRFASKQHGMFTTAQAFRFGATRSFLAHRTRSGAFDRLAPRVLSIGGLPLTAERRVFAGWLESGGRSALSHETAGAYWEYPGFRSEPVQVVRLRDGVFPPVSLAQVHTTRELPDTQVVEADGLLVTTPARTLFDLAPRIHPGRLEKLLDRAWSRRLVDRRIMHRTLDELAGRGTAGIVVMRQLLEDRPANYVAPESNLEGRFRKVLRDDAQCEMDRQVNVGTSERWCGRVDFIDRERKVIVEVQSDLHHASVSDVRSDEERARSLTEAGWQVVEVAEFDLWHRPADVQRKVRAARSGR
jgi:very-short-patch-repair endonuclease